MPSLVAVVARPVAALAPPASRGATRGARAFAASHLLSGQAELSTATYGAEITGVAPGALCNLKQLAAHTFRPY